jgi:hypothetical protein
MKTIQFQYLSALFGALAAGVGCSNPASESAAKQVALEDYRAQFSSTLGDKLIECCTDSELATVLGPGRGRPETDAATPMWRAAIDDGVLAYDAGDAADHLAAVAAMTCDELAVFLVEASQGDGSFMYAPFEGLLADGEPCDTNLLCASRYCGFDVAAERAVCMQKPGAGGGCSPGCSAGRCCADGLHCAFADVPAGPQMPAPSLGGMCTAKKADGASCFEHAECASGACVGGDQGSATQGTCGAPTLCAGK